MQHMPIETQLKTLIRSALSSMGVEASEVPLERPAVLSHGDFSTNVAMATLEIGRAHV